MMLKKYLFRTIVVAIAMSVLDFFGHPTLLGREYVYIEPIIRSKADMDTHMPFALISCFCFSAALVWIYSQGRNSKKPWLGQGLRFGIAIWAVASVPQYLKNYVVEPWAGSFVAKLLGWKIFIRVILGLLVAALSKNDRTDLEFAR